MYLILGYRIGKRFSNVLKFKFNFKSKNQVQGFSYFEFGLDT